MCVDCVRNLTGQTQQFLLDVMWHLWPALPMFGCKAAQFVDLIGYFLLKAANLPHNKVCDGVGVSAGVSCPAVVADR